MATFTKGREYEPFSRVTMWVDDEHFYTAGDDTGRELRVDNPQATQQMVNDALERIKGYVYRPFEATGVDIDPAAELGDAVTIGGIYSVIAHTTEYFDAAGTFDISAPGEREVDHEYPYIDPVTRELKRRVKLGQKYQGVSITRKDGLVIEKLIDEVVAARVVMNADKLAFYGPNDEEQLYFDPAEGVYKFRGALNVNDNFVVAPNGDLTAKGNINLAGNINMSGGVITWGQNGPVKYQFSSAGVTGPWHDTMQTNDKYRRDSLDGGTTWGSGYQFVGVDGKPGQDGSDGSDATVPKYITETVIAKGVVAAPQIYANDFSVYPPDESAEYAGSFNLYGMFQGMQRHLFTIYYRNNGMYMPEIAFGSPDGVSSVDWSFSRTNFNGWIDFSGASVTGATFVLA